jgi:branched-chain amino acid transport system substrate-binding protein
MKSLIATTTRCPTLLTLCFAGCGACRHQDRGIDFGDRPRGFLGDPEAKTLEMLVEQINAAGGINGEKIELVFYDDNGDPNKARTFATRLIEDDEVVAIIGGSTTGATMSILAVAEDAKVPFISLAGAIDIIQPVKKFTFKTPHTDRMACQKIFEDMKKRASPRSA